MQTLPFPTWPIALPPERCTNLENSRTISVLVVKMLRGTNTASYPVSTFPGCKPHHVPFQAYRRDDNTCDEHTCTALPKQQQQVRESNKSLTCPHNHRPPYGSWLLPDKSPPHHEQLKTRRATVEGAAEFTSSPQPANKNNPAAKFLHFWKHTSSQRLPKDP